MFTLKSKGEREAKNSKSSTKMGKVKMPKEKKKVTKKSQKNPKTNKPNPKAVDFNWRQQGKGNKTAGKNLHK